MPWDDDEMLVAGLKAHNGGAVQYAIETYAPKLYHYALLQLEDPQAAEDLVSEVVQFSRYRSGVLDRAPCISSYRPCTKPYLRYLYACSTQFAVFHLPMRLSELYSGIHIFLDRLNRIS